VNLHTNDGVDGIDTGAGDFRAERSARTSA
jgi:hypothetical protein